MNKRIVLSLLFFSLSLGVLAQDPASRQGSSIVDDSTRNVYGPQTTRFILERDFVLARDTFHVIDTSIVDYNMQFDPIELTGYRFHDLGNIGTALNPLYPTAPQVVGRRLGVDAYDIYFFDPQTIKHYDTKSPYSYFDVIWGGNGRAKTEVGYTRNVNPRWNFGGTYLGYQVDKQVSRLNRGDRNARSIGYAMFSHYLSENGKYRLFSTFDRTRHEVAEQGGIRVNDPEDRALFFLTSASAYLRTAESVISKNQLHLYHDYTFAELFRLFHRGDIINRRVEFTVNKSNEGSFFDGFEIDSLGLRTDDTRYQEFQNDLGFTGTYQDFYYSVYYRRRDLSLSNIWLKPDSVGIASSVTEHYGGFETGWHYKDKFLIDLKGFLRANGTSRLEGTIRSKWFDASVVQAVWEPSWYQSVYRGQFDYWVRDHENQYMLEIKGKAKIGAGPVKLMPGAEHRYFERYITFRDMAISGQGQVVPIQSNGNIIVFSPFIGTETRFGSFVAETDFRYNKVYGGGSINMPMPEYQFLARTYVHDLYFDRHLEVQAGIQVQWRSGYYAMAYDPAIQQFFVQYDFFVPDYWLIGVFANAKIWRGQLFVQMNNLRELLNATGYFTTPFYRGLQPTFDFGFKMPFFD